MERKTKMDMRYTENEQQNGRWKSNHIKITLMGID